MSSRLLIIEDESQIADFLLRGLGEEGFSVQHVSDGRIAWQLLQEETFDLILLDWWLPGEDGIDVLRRFRGINRETPVLFLTARDSVSHKVEGLDAGADDYLAKPFAFAELLARVRALLRRPNQPSGLHLEYGDVRADLGSQKATRDGSTLGLTAKEFSLLCLFLQNPGKVLTRTRIFDTVWGDTFDGLSNTIEVHIKELRRKLEQYGPRVIQTRRGRGYVLEANSPEDELT
ncbi:response regulator transcription factor [Bremerella sp. T1]|uniref:response regulator transcription factor n=1 Tax=Bremerella sp. TYQ1 TaxID=3119568 RepID=UPI001CCF655B|nr:response regulator transcription factor [Bremerella volcania]UBM33774.1 response regulator transcription factor [Bremerella volcania]